MAFLSGSSAFIPRILLRIALLVISAGTAACLVLSVNPAYDDESLSWDPALVGEWHDVDDNASMIIERGEWRSYRVHYVHPIETGDLTGYLTSIGNQQYLDLMPGRGADRGSFLIPVHAVLRVRVDGDRLEVTPLSYDWFYDRLRAPGHVPSLSVTMDQKKNALVTSPTATLRSWLRAQPAEGQMFGAAAVFERGSGR